MPPTNVSWRTIRPAEGFYNSQVWVPDPQPVRTFLPTGYEPNYPYPLLVFFHGHGGNERQALRLAPRLSRRNFICISLRGPDYVGTRRDGRLGFGWGPEGQSAALVEDYVLRAVEQTRREYHVHSERIFLAGLCEGAAVAYRLALMAPEKYGGMISLNGAYPRHGGPLFRYPAVRDLRLFIGHGIANSVVPLSTARADQQLFYSAGLEVAMHTYPTNHRLHPDMFRDVNRWMVEFCSQ